MKEIKRGHHDMSRQPVASPHEWIDVLHKQLGSTRCRIRNAETPLSEGLRSLAEEFASAHSRDATVWWAGNGGSAALCSHIAQDVMNKLETRSIVLSDSALLTCMANDFGYEDVYRRPLSVMARPDDLLIVISSSGMSPNILACAELALKRGLRLVTLSAFRDDNRLWLHPATIAFYLPCSLYGHAEIGHACLLHSVIDTLAGKK